MHHHYNDIRDRIASEPKWFDEHAVPRYSKFFPDESANIYADEVLLLLIRCQDCGYHFTVCMSSSNMDVLLSAFRAFEYKVGRKPDDAELATYKKKWTLAHAVRADTIHYGDPPNACPEGCIAGATMNSIPMRVLQFWRRDKMKWERVSELEREIECEWANEAAD